MDRDWFERLLRYVPEGLKNQAYVAGGYAFAPMRARDIDLWIISGSYEAMYLDAVSVVEHLQTFGDYSKFTATEMVPYEGNGRERLLVQTIPGVYEGKDLQILVSAARTPQELVDGFDINIHAVAKQVHSEDGGRCYRTWFGEKWDSNILQVQRWDTPEQTLQRLEKLAARYHLTPSAEDISLLAMLIADEQKKWKVAA